MSSEEDSSMDVMSDQSLKGCKIKRTRQRVDAGEPRNSYASIANFSSRGGYLNHPYHQYSNGLNISPNSKFIGDLISKSSSENNSSKANNSDMIVIDDAVMQLVNGGLSAGQIAPPFVNGAGNGLNSLHLKTETNNNNNISNCNNNNSSHSSDLEFNFKTSGSYMSSKGMGSEVSVPGAHLLRDILQTGRKLAENSGDQCMERADQSNHGIQSQSNSSGNNKLANSGKGGEGGLSQCSDASDLDDEENERPESRDDDGMDHIINSTDQSSPIKDKSLLESSRSPSPALSAQSNRPNAHNSSPAIADVKRARVENIVSNMLLGGNGPTVGGLKGGNGDAVNASVNGCKKRKLYQPQQSKLNDQTGDEDEEVEYLADEEDDDEDVVTHIDLSAKRAKTENRNDLRRQLEDMQSQLIAMRQRYVELFEAQQLQQKQLSLTSSPVNLTTAVSADDDLDDTEMEEMASDKGPNTPASQLSELTNRDMSANVTPTARHPMPGAGDASHFLDEARRLISEQEKIARRSDRQSCIVRNSGSTQAPIPDMDWLIDSLKTDIQSSVMQIIDTTFSKYIQKRQTKLPFDSNESKNEITILSQMLDRKSPRTKVIDRGAAIGAATIGNAIKTNINGHSSRGSPFSLPTETAPAPRPTPFSFPTPNFKSPFYMPNVAPVGAQMPQQPAIIPSALAHHFNSIASSLSQRSEQSNNYCNRDIPNIPVNTNGHSNSHLFSRSDEPLPEQTEAMALVVAPKRKRHKVTDTRITPRTVSRLLGQDSLMMCNNRDASSVSPPNSMVYGNHGPSQPPPPLVPVSLPTSVAIPNPSLHHTDLFSGTNFPFGDHPRLSLFGDDSDMNRDGKSHSAVVSAVAHAAAAHHLHMLAASRASPDSLHGYPATVMPGLQYGRGGSDNGNEGSETNETQVYDPTLTPMHLRKAKLMFFFVRYPSSAILKMFFPDIKFNKNNTAQLVKWFSNFREFYYIQMEKYARQALSEGVKNSEELHVSHDSELLRVLNLHYNRNNHIDVPENFRYVSEQTLREFFKAVQSGKDSEQSWKKAIYKVIARLDDNVPEYFKSPNFLEQLE
ncbi:unnamed protein product [Medioppia subpectinata]|uniref:Homeobox protein prospero n=1 Tax=Medioppia subpectinata TaxID=1979941 RepID=A0A7R9KIS8_9ACAR|nr:unnamed protein product [Medioppia subpectinata]CAG2102938.1 unnamed protein product [Medioppia subpectinata]